MRYDRAGLDTYVAASLQSINVGADGYTGRNGPSLLRRAMPKDAKLRVADSREASVTVFANTWPDFSYLSSPSVEELRVRS